MLESIPTIDDVQKAARCIASVAHRTPVLTSRSLDRLCGASLFFKCENFQRAGAFKFRGAYNAVQSLSQHDAQCGVVTHSSGNHAAALALAASLRGIKAHIVMPQNAPAVKRAAVEAFGGNIVLCPPTLEARESFTAETIERTGAVLVHPYDDPRVIAGQGTVALETLDQVADLDAVIASVSGGGLLSGISIATRSLSPRVEIYGAEPQMADDAARSLAAGKLLPAGPTNTIADGLRAQLSQRTFEILSKHVREILLVSEEQIVEAMRLIWERLKIVVEPSGATSFAAAIARRDLFEGRRVGMILSGGNLDLDRLPWQ